MANRKRRIVKSTDIRALCAVYYAYTSLGLSAYGRKGPKDVTEDLIFARAYPARGEDHPFYSDPYSIYSSDVNWTVDFLELVARRISEFAGRGMTLEELLETIDGDFYSLWLNVDIFPRPSDLTNSQHIAVYDAAVELESLSRSGTGDFYGRMAPIAKALEALTGRKVVYGIAFDPHSSLPDQDRRRLMYVCAADAEQTLLGELEYLLSLGYSWYEIGSDGKKDWVGWANRSECETPEKAAAWAAGVLGVRPDDVEVMPDPLDVRARDEDLG